MSSVFSRAASQLQISGSVILDEGKNIGIIGRFCPNHYTMGNKWGLVLPRNAQDLQTWVKTKNVKECWVFVEFNLKIGSIYFPTSHTFFMPLSHWFLSPPPNVNAYGIHTDYINYHQITVWGQICYNPVLKLWGLYSIPCEIDRSRMKGLFRKRCE